MFSTFGSSIFSYFVASGGGIVIFNPESAYEDFASPFSFCDFI
jgi:hypothetical protein